MGIKGEDTVFGVDQHPSSAVHRELGIGEGVARHRNVVEPVLPGVYEYVVGDGCNPDPSRPVTYNIGDVVIGECTRIFGGEKVLIVITGVFIESMNRPYPHLSQRVLGEACDTGMGEGMCDDDTLTGSCLRLLLFLAGAREKTEQHSEK